MTNRELASTRKYHNETKHSISSVHNDPHFLDFGNQPLPFKIYTDLEPIPLPRDFPETRVSALAAIAGGGSLEGESVPNLATLAGILHYSAGITKKRSFPGGEILFRAAACTGALYHIELYLVCGDLPGLEAGVYHFGVHDSALRLLREGDHRGILIEAAGYQTAIAHAPAVVISTSTYWRNSWKYRSRAYRHCFWDSGTILANLLAASTAHSVPATIIAGFVDSMVNQLLDLDTKEEVALSLVPLGRFASGLTDSSSQIAGLTPKLNLKTMPLSKSQIDYPEIREMHTASSLADAGEVQGWLGPTEVPAFPPISGRECPLISIGDHGEDTESLEKVIRRRGSAREFSQESISLKQLSSILHQSTRGVPADFLDPPGTTLNRLYLLVNDVRGLAPGSYVYHPDAGTLELLEEGELRGAAGYLGLQQAIPADASVDVFLLADLDHILDRYGNRGYRAAELEAGIIGGQMYLAAYAQRLGASGLTFFDDDVINMFSPHAENMSVMFLVALGVPARRRS